ncbi:MAG: response regulator [Anaerolineaceae bacterium]|nr:response regulator [Anaerolineaceae bacterium]
MIWQLLGHLISIFVTLFIARYSWKKRSQSGSVFFTLYMLSAAIWSLFTLFTDLSQNPFIQTLFTNLSLIGIVIMPISWVGFAFDYTGWSKWLSNRTLILLAIIPSVSLPIIWIMYVNRIIRFLNGELNPGPHSLYKFFFGLIFIYAALLLILGTMLIMNEYGRSSSRSRRQFGLLMFGALFPWVVALAWQFGFNPFERLAIYINPISYAIALGGLSSAWGLFRYRIFDIMPVALDTLVESISEGVFVVSNQKHIVHTNPAADQIMQLALKGDLSRSLFDKDQIFHELNFDNPQSEININIGTSQLFFDLQISPIFNRRDHISAHLLLLHDITKRKLADEALIENEEKFRHFIEQTSDGIILTDESGNIVEWNQGSEDITGFKKEETIGQPIWNILLMAESDNEEMDHKSSSFEKMILNAQITGAFPRKNKYRDIHIRRSDHEKRTMEGLMFPIQTHRGIILGMIFRDVTRSRENAEELRSAKEDAETANRAKSTFLANMSHELRTPLNAILGFSQLMKRDSHLTQSQKNNLDTIGRSGEHLLALINDILEISKIEAGRIALIPSDFDLHRMLAGLEEMFELRASQKNLQLIFDIQSNLPRFIRADDSKLRQILINLLGNAVKFTAEGGITLRVGYEEKSNEELIIFCEIEDSGPGIEESELEILFDPFVQSENSQHAQEGTGLGLTISRRYARTMGGDLTVQSKISQGSLFKFHVLASPADEQEILLEEKRMRVIGLKPGQKPFRLLVVEDRSTSRDLLVKLLSSIGFEVRSAINGKEGVKVWEDWDPHLIWMDMRMPVMDGYAATRHIKATTKGQATVIVALTASAFEEDREIILSEGCDDFIRKPFREDEIFSVLQKHLGVEFTYDNVDQPSSTISLSSGDIDLSHIPENLRQSLLEAVDHIDSDEIQQVILIIRKTDPRIADLLAELSSNFEYEKIMELLTNGLE